MALPSPTISPSPHYMPCPFLLDTTCHSTTQAGRHCGTKPVRGAEGKVQEQMVTDAVEVGTEAHLKNSAWALSFLSTLELTS